MRFSLNLYSTFNLSISLNIISKDDAKKILKEKPIIPEEEINLRDYILDKLDIDKNEFNLILNYKKLQEGGQDYLNKYSDTNGTASDKNYLISSMVRFKRNIFDNISFKNFIPCFNVSKIKI